MMTRDTERLRKAVDMLAADVPAGELLAAMGPADLLNGASAHIRDLSDLLSAIVCSHETDGSVHPSWIDEAKDLLAGVTEANR